MLPAATRDLVKATVPVLQEHGLALTKHFYARMFAHNPELKHLFNQAHQASGQQQRALSDAVLAYAQHIDGPEVLMPVLSRVAHKHASIGIRAEHYPIVGKHLLASIKEVLGDAASDELIAAWAAAYGQLADLLVSIENGLYRQAALAPGGWSGWRPFRVGRRVTESDEITSFYLYPVDGAPAPDFTPGQFVSVRGRAAGGAIVQPRQYSLSDAPNGDYLRLSIKREHEDAQAGRPRGHISNWMHDEVPEGAIIELSPPFGDFVLKQANDENAGAPLVLISGGVGLTPMIAMLNEAVRAQGSRPVHFIHGARHRGVHALGDHVRELASRHKQVNVTIFYEEASGSDRPGHDYDLVGRVDLRFLPGITELKGAEYYVCGPIPFMDAQLKALRAAGVPESQLHFEVFGSQTGLAA